MKPTNNIDELFVTAEKPAEFARGYFRYLKEVLDNLDPDALNQLVQEFEDAREKGQTIFVAGNGGSAATASSMANDIGFDIIKKTSTNKPFKVFSLTDNNSVITAIANDVGYENLFTSQLKIHYKPGDKLLAISVSGNSPNVVNAAEWVREHGGRVMGFLGFDGGKLKNICDVAVQAMAEKGEYGPVEDAHLVLNHVLAHWFQCKLK